MDLETRKNPPDEANQAEVLHDDGVYSPVNGVTQKLEGLRELGRFDEDVERQIHAPAAPTGEATLKSGLLEEAQAEGSVLATV